MANVLRNLRFWQYLQGIKSYVELICFYSGLDCNARMLWTLPIFKRKIFLYIVHVAESLFADFCCTILHQLKFRFLSRLLVYFQISLVFAVHKAFNNVIGNHWARRMVLPIKIHLPKRIGVNLKIKKKLSLCEKIKYL